MSSNRQAWSRAAGYLYVFTSFLLLFNEASLLGQQLSEEIRRTLDMFPPPPGWETDPRFNETARLRFRAYEEEKRLELQQKLQMNSMQQAQAAEAAVALFYEGAPSQPSEALLRFVANKPEITLSPKYPAVQEYIKLRQQQEQAAIPLPPSAPAATPTPAAPATSGKDLTPEQMMKLAEMKIASPAAYEEAVKMFQQAGYSIATSGKPKAAVPEGKAVAAMTASDKMARIIFPSIKFENATLSNALQYLDIFSREYDTFSADGNKGVRITLREGGNASNVALNFDLKNIPMLEALRYITELAQMKYQIEGEGVLVTPLLPATNLKSN